VLDTKSPKYLEMAQGHISLSLAHSSSALTRPPLRSSHPMGDVASMVDLPSMRFVWSQLFSSDLLLVETVLIVVFFAGGRPLIRLQASQISKPSCSRRRSSRSSLTIWQVHSQIRQVIPFVSQFGCKERTVF
jgi:hypothetical protein